MAQLDAMLRALASRGAQELVLQEGDRPLFRFPEGDRPVSQAALNRAQILRLLSELAGPEVSVSVASGGPASFLYSLPDGASFECTLGGNGSVTAHVRRAAASPSEPASQPVVASRPDAARIERHLRQLVEAGGSDLHLTAGEIPMMRVNGSLERVKDEPRCSAEGIRGLVGEIMPERIAREFDETHDADFAYQIPGVARFRFNAFVDHTGPGVVARVIPDKILTVGDLGLPTSIVDLCRLSKGLILVTGPTGSGKSTTLAALADLINRERCDHIITIEDPIEFVHPSQSCLVNQREVGSHTGSFKRALRAALRQDPDIVLVGELRDLETVAIAIETAETGHLVFGTLHTTTAASTIDRLIDQFPADRQSQIRTMLSESLRGVVSQTLLKKKGGGRVAALEVLVVTPAISNLIREGKTFQIPSIMQTGKKHGMVLLNDALVDLVRRKVVEPGEALAKSTDPDALANQLRSAGITAASGAR